MSIENAKTVADFEAIKKQAEEGIARLKNPPKADWQVGDVVCEYGGTLHLIVKYQVNPSKYGFVPLVAAGGGYGGEVYSISYHKGYDSPNAIRDNWSSFKRVGPIGKLIKSNGDHYNPEITLLATKAP